MSTRAECDECQAILEELMGALAELRALSPKLKDELRARCEAFFGMLGGTEEDLELAERVLGKFQLGPQRPGSVGTDDSEPRYPRIRDAFRRMSEHRLRTGHKVLSLK